MRIWYKVVIALALASSIAIIAFAAGFGAHWLLSRTPAVTLLPFSFLGRNSPTTPEEAEHFAVFWEAWDILKREFYGDLPDAQHMTYAAIRGVLQVLNDPPTVLVEPKPRELEKAQLQGSFGGIGAYVSKQEDGSFTLSPMPDTPAARAGILKGDTLIRVDNTDLTPEMSLEDVVLLIRGPAGTLVRLTVRRSGSSDLLTFEITREKIETPTVEWRLVEEHPHIGYVHLMLFSERTSKELKNAIQDLRTQGATHLIVDLRGNPGGVLEAALEVASQFVSDGAAFYERRRNGSEKRYDLRSGGVALDMPLAVLVDGGTASASEIVAGVIQDRRRGPLIGEKTFGKGSVQLVYDLSDGSSLHVTVARWLTPNKHMIDGHGLQPDIYIPITEQDRQQRRDPQMERAQNYLLTGQ